MYENLHKEPLILNRNRVKRAYTGGKLLDQWQGIQPAQDGQFPEEFLISTVEVTNADRYPGEGLSKVTLGDGSEVSLSEIIASDPDAFLGNAYSQMTGGDLGVLARLGDPTVRLVIQAHPDREHANEYLKFPNGKTEAWYIVETRQIGDGPYTYAGFKQGVTRTDWEDLFERQDIQGMLDAMHRIEIAKGDVLLIEAGMPHAIGPGALFLEVHEPCDYTFRLEKQYLTGRVFTDEEIHYGIGLEGLFDAFHYDTYSQDEIVDKVVVRPQRLKETDEACEYALITYDHTERFAMNKIEVWGEYRLEPYVGHAIAVLTRGEGSFLYGDGQKEVQQGQGVFLPAGIEDLTFVGEMEVIVAFPPLLKS